MCILNIDIIKVISKIIRFNLKFLALIAFLLISLCTLLDVHRLLHCSLSNLQVSQVVKVAIHTRFLCKYFILLLLLEAFNYF